MIYKNPRDMKEYTEEVEITFRPQGLPIEKFFEDQYPENPHQMRYFLLFEEGEAKLQKICLNETTLYLMDALLRFSTYTKHKFWGSGDEMRLPVFIWETREVFLKELPEVSDAVPALGIHDLTRGKKGLECAIHLSSTHVVGGPNLSFSELYFGLYGCDRFFYEKCKKKYEEYVNMEK